MTNPAQFCHKRLVALLGMTTSSNDGEALNAIRAANREIAKLGFTWAEFVAARVTVVADPFDSIPVPPTPAPKAPTPKAPSSPTYNPPPYRPAPRPKRQPKIQLSDADLGL